MTRMLLDNAVLRTLAKKLRNSSCPKIGHDTREAAEEQVRALLRGGRDWYDSTMLHVYRCPDCRRWHVGHLQKRWRGDKGGSE